jgi:hypothetical protein
VDQSHDREYCGHEVGVFQGPYVIDETYAPGPRDATFVSMLPIRHKKDPPSQPNAVQPNGHACCDREAPAVLEPSG